MSNYKDSSRAWRAERASEQRASDNAAKEAREKRNEQNAILKAHSYVWQKIQDVFGPSDDGDSADMVWQLFDAAGEPVSVKEALAAIAAQTVEAATAKAAEVKPLKWDGSHGGAYWSVNSAAVEVVVSA